MQTIQINGKIQNSLVLWDLLIFQVLYNLHRFKDSVKDYLILVEGFFEVFNLWQERIKNVVALMEVSLSKQQERLLIIALGKGGRLSVMMDKDDTSKKAEKEILERLIDKMLVRVAA